ncbi:MAG: hypothetical protein P1U62_14985, partial [Alteraurantiacibacter sp. bin_em_oilr2.035]|nr:hypothetical protein [Alteraurantiacibacter sp. bin_em_oilr2.035]
SDALDEIDALPPVEQEAPLINYLREIVSNSQSRLIDENLEATGHEAALVFDISDLIGYWRNARLPTGIQRVQIETIMAALPDEERLSQERREVLLCCFTHGREDWLEVPIGQFRSLCDLAVS